MKTQEIIIVVGIVFGIYLVGIIIWVSGNCDTCGGTGENELMKKKSSGENYYDVGRREYVKINYSCQVCKGTGRKQVE